LVIFSRYASFLNNKTDLHDIAYILLLELWYLTPLSTIFQLYHGGQFYWWSKPPICRKSLPKFLSHNVVRVHFTISGIRTTLVVIDTDSIGSCTSTITTTPKYCWKKQDTSITPYDSNISQVVLDYCSTFCFNFQSKYSSPWECYLTKMLCKYGMVLWLDDVQTFSSNNNWKYDFMGGLQGHSI
jgi:hypothetical protein